MPLFTVILDYQGGTYTKQVRARSFGQALVTWARTVDPDDIYGIGRKSLQTLRQTSWREEALPLDGCKNVWCAAVRVRGKLALLNVVQTVP